MNNLDKARYLAEARKSNLHPKKLTLNISTGFRNADNTADEKAAVGGCWKEYWKTFAREDFPIVCPFCGKALAEDETDGCHINVLMQDSLGRRYYTRKSYIIPGHHTCNMQFGDEFASSTIVTAVEAFEK